MSLTSGTNLGLLVRGEPGEEHYDALMRQWRGFDSLIQPRIITKNLNAPPVSPVNGDSYIVGASPTGAWASHATHIARWDSVASLWDFFVPKAGWYVFILDVQRQHRYTGTAWIDSDLLISDVNYQINLLVPDMIAAGGAGGPQSIIIACGQEDSVVSTALALVTFRMPYSFVLTDVRASVKTSQGSGELLTIEVLANDASIMSTPITIDNGAYSNKSATTPYVLNTTTLYDDDSISINVTQSGDLATGLKVYLIGNYSTATP